MKNNRRDFLAKLSLGAFALSIGGLSDIQADIPGKQKFRNLCLGVIADIHQDLQPDAVRCLQAFVDKAKQVNPDFIIQLGDLSHGIHPDKIVAVWNQYPRKISHVLGNHNMDNTHKAELLQKQQMAGKYYSFDGGDFHFVVLDSSYCHIDGHYIDFEEGNSFACDQAYCDLISPEELDWLAADLQATDKPTVIFSHQGLDKVWDGWSIPNRLDVRRRIRKANRYQKKEIACFYGHQHVDYHMVLEDVAYFQVNSASNYWIDGPKIYSNGCMAEYKDPLFAFVTLDCKHRALHIEGTKSEFCRLRRRWRHFSVQTCCIPE